MNQPLLHRRQSLRAPAYDYTQPGAYFITVVTLNRVCLLGGIRGKRFSPTAAGDAVRRIWDGLPSRFSSVELDEFIVMPNHVHGILWLTDESTLPRVSLGAVVGAFKLLATREVNATLNRKGSLWQRNYFERVVRDDAELKAVRAYIIQNPLRWALDAENQER